MDDSFFLLPTAVNRSSIMLLKIAFVSLNFITVLFLYRIGKKAISAVSDRKKRDINLLVGGLVGWQLFILALSSTDLLKSYDFPPRFALAFIIPSFIFTVVFLYKSRNKNWIKQIPESWIVYFQSFRILVETLFVFALARGIFNYHVTIEGYNYDMIFGFTAPIIGYLVYQKKILSRKAVLIWNFLGLLVLSSVIFLFVVSIYRPEIFGSDVLLVPMESFGYPYVLIAGFLMPVAVFLHVLSIIQLRKNQGAIG